VAASARRVIERQTRHMAQLLNDLQDVSRATAGKLLLERRRLDLAQLVWRPLDALRLAGRLRNHAITLDLQRTVVDADPVRMEQVLVNLLTNAVKYTPAGGHVELTLRPDGDAALIEVRDSGVGISPELLSQVFDIFVQGERTADRRQGGMGLGLTLVRRLVELHGGSVRADSEGPDRGSTFALRLPAAEPETGAPALPLRGCHGVVLGLDTARPFEIEGTLCGAGCRVTSSSDIGAGLDVIAARQPDFVLVDAASALAERVRATGTPALVVGLGDGGAGCDVLMPQPLDLQLLRQHLAARQTGARAA
jgi:two-component sensor histidine kinase